MAKEKIPLDPVKIHRKLKMVNDLFHMAMEIKKFQLKKKFPHLSEREITHRAYALIEKGCS